MLYYARKDGCERPVAEGYFPSPGETLVIKRGGGRRCRCGGETREFT